MSGPFGSTYAEAYDLLYREKDYEAECDLIEQIFQTSSQRPLRTVLDLGCGTGNHVIPLMRRGYQVVGVDGSESMVARARSKLPTELADGKVTIEQGDIRRLQLHRTFDAVLMMFAVLGYQTKNEDVLATLETARRHLEPGGILLADVWYGPAVLNLRPGDRVRVNCDEGRTVIRVSSGELDIRHHLCHVRLRLWEMNGGQVVSEIEEHHEMRYFFPRELELFLETTGFRLVRLGCFPQVEQEPDEDTWEILAVASAR